MLPVKVTGTAIVQNGERDSMVFYHVTCKLQLHLDRHTGIQTGLREHEVHTKLQMINYRCQRPNFTKATWCTIFDVM